jgi:acetamidase/formamidase
MVHSKWNRSLEPIATVSPDEVVEIDLRDTTGGFFKPQMTAKQLFSGMTPGHSLTGPIYVEGAMPGDTLVVRILEVKNGKWGFSATMPGKGFLGDLSQHQNLITWEANEDNTFAESLSLPGVRVAIAPFCGVLGVAPGDDGEFSTLPPKEYGGNMDIKYLTKGSTLFLPVFNKGALFSVGDAHMAQGDGEVCISGIETSAKVTLQFQIEKGKRIPEPRFETPTHFGITAYSKTIDDGCQKALNYAITFLREEKNLSWDSAYMLCSVAADLKVFEVVDVPHVLCGLMIPKDVLSGMK